MPTCGSSSLTGFELSNMPRHRAIDPDQDATFYRYGWFRN